MMVCEMALYYKLKNMTLYDALMEVYEEFGYFREGLKSYTRTGKAGTEEIAQSMNSSRRWILKTSTASRSLKSKLPDRRRNRRGRCDHKTFLAVFQCRKVHAGG